MRLLQLVITLSLFVCLKLNHIKFKKIRFEIYLNIFKYIN